MHLPRVTKYDTAALLIAEGVRRGFCVVPEFTVELSAWGKTKSGAACTKGLDIVWLVRRRGARKLQSTPWSDHWHIAAAFEIEGCNVSLGEKGSFTKDKVALESVRTRNRCPKERFIVLYTAAHDRSSLADVDIVKAYETRNSALRGTTVSLLVCGQFKWRSRLPIL